MNKIKFLLYIIKSYINNNAYYNINYFIADILAYWLNSVKDKMSLPSNIYIDNNCDYELSEKIHNDNINFMINNFANYKYNNIYSEDNKFIDDMNKALELLKEYFYYLWL